MAMAVDVQFACSDTGIPTEQYIQEWVRIAATRSGRAEDSQAEVTVRVVDVGEIQTLNRLFREKDTATNVLSFPAGEIEGLPDSALRQLGDIVVCATVVSEEAAQQDKSVADHWAHMLVHGMLHLLGYDHESAADAEQMERLEATILESRGVSDPYASP